MVSCCSVVSPTSGVSTVELPGVYMVEQDNTIVGPDLIPSAESLCKLQKGERVFVKQVETVGRISRVRGLIDDPPGWISLRNTSSGRTWAHREAEKPGAYIVERDNTIVGPDLVPSAHEVCKLRKGQRIIVEEVQMLDHAFRVRARIQDPPGWISLSNMSTGQRWARQELEENQLRGSSAQKQFADYEARLRQALDPLIYVQISDVSDGHTVEGARTGRALDADGRELRVLCVSSIFEDHSMLEQQQMVNEVLLPELKSGKIHSVHIECLVPQQWHGAGATAVVDAPQSPVTAAPRVAASPSPVQSRLHASLTALINRHDVMLFMKGYPGAEQCGFSRRMVELLRQQGVQFDAFNILDNQEVRQGLKDFSRWPTYPQLYSKGKLLGGLDVITNLVQTGQFQQALS